ncbi:unnamed protein product [Echinostoma caproni]|uniref:Uncharacterized protein n=1 Tax=Echinostoma caproni TaxID=27848 RepID=A0A183AJN1_9TREM|nr:unnamed protein product [Echinostoma caproni]
MPVIVPSHNNGTTYFEHLHPDEQLPLKLGLILLACTIIVLFVALLFLICRRLRRYARLLNEKDYNDNEDDLDSDVELTQFDLEKFHLAATSEQKAKSTTPGSIRRHDAKEEGAVEQTVAPQTSKAIEEVPLSAFSIGDEEDEASEDGYASGNTTAGGASRSGTKESHTGGLNPTNCYAKPERIQIVTKAVAVQQPVREIQTATAATATTATDVQRTDTMTKLVQPPSKMDPEEIEEIVSQLEQPQTIPLPHSDVFDEPLKPGSDHSEKSTLVGLDDANLFEDCAEDDELGLFDEEIVESTTGGDTSLGPDKKARSTDSIGDIGAIRPLLPIHLPDWALQSGQAERGFLVFSVRINRKPGAGPNWYLVDVCIREARCILSQHTEPRAGKFYVKARVQPTGM